MRMWFLGYTVRAPVYRCTSRSMLLLSRVSGVGCFYVCPPPGDRVMCGIRRVSCVLFSRYCSFVHVLVFALSVALPTVNKHMNGNGNDVQEFHRYVLQEAFVGLLRSKVRLDRPEAMLPETLSSDGARLALARDDVDRVTLVATLCVLLRQVCCSLLSRSIQLLKFCTTMARPCSTRSSEKL